MSEHYEGGERVSECTLRLRDQAIELTRRRERENMLNDVTIVFGFVEYDDDGNAYAASATFKGDTFMTLEQFKRWLDDGEHPFVDIAQAGS